MMGADTLQNALALSNSGFEIFPCGSDKKPLVTHWQTDASNKPEIICAWWTQYPLAMIGLPTGESSGVYVVDLDVDKETGDAIGKITLQRLGFSELLKTVPMVRTPSGGLHLFFKHSKGLRNTASKIGPKIDTRGEGGYVIAPGSKNELGAYETQGTIDWHNLPELPVAFLSQLEKASIVSGNHKWAMGALQDELARVNAAQEGMRNDTLNRASFAIGQIIAGGNLDTKEVLPKLLFAASAIGLPQPEAEATIRSGFRAGADSPRGPKWESTHLPEPETAEQVWPEPHQRFLKDALIPAPELPLDRILCPDLAKWTKEAAAAKGAPPDYVFSALLSVAGSLIGNARWSAPWRGWQEPPIIWTMCIGLPSAGKSPAIDAVLQPLRKAEKPLRQRARAELDKWRETADLAKIVEAEWKRNVQNAVKNGDSPPIKPASANPGPQPHSPRLLLNDSTIEKLAAIVSAQPKGTLQARDELAGWLESMTRYAGGGTDRPFWLEAYGGRGYTVERMGREPLSIDRLSVGVVGGIQPDRLYDLLFKSVDDGLLARFIPIWPDPVPPVRPMAWADECFVEGVLQRLLELEMQKNEKDETRPWFNRFSESACKRLDAFRLKVRGWENASDGLMLSFIGKLPGLAVRLSLVLAYLDYASEGGEEPFEISENHFDRAGDLVENYLLPMAQRAYANASVPKDERSALRLIALIRERKWDHFSSRQVMRLDRAGLARKQELDPALSVLDQADCIRAMPVKSGSQGGRKERQFVVNPAVFSSCKEYK
jgi:hypothetical protein